MCDFKGHFSLTMMDYSIKFETMTCNFKGHMAWLYRWSCMVIIWWRDGRYMRESLQLSKAMVREGDKPMKLELGDAYGNHCNWILHHLCSPEAWLTVELKASIAIMVRWRQILFGFVVVEVGLIWESLRSFKQSNGCWEWGEVCSRLAFASKGSAQVLLWSLGSQGPFARSWIHSGNNVWGTQSS